MFLIKSISCCFEIQLSIIRFELSLFAARYWSWTNRKFLNEKKSSEPTIFSYSLALQWILMFDQFTTNHFYSCKQFFFLYTVKQRRINSQRTMYTIAYFPCWFFVVVVLCIRTTCTRSYKKTWSKEMECANNNYDGKHKMEKKNRVRDVRDSSAQQSKYSDYDYNSPAKQLIKMDCCSQRF